MMVFSGSVKVRINDVEVLEVCCGKGKQTMRWLALTSAERYNSMELPKGQLRQRESRTKNRGRFIPVNVLVNRVSIHPHARIKDVVKAVKLDELRRYDIDAFNNVCKEEKGGELSEFVSIGDVRSHQQTNLHGWSEGVVGDETVVYENDVDDDDDELNESKNGSDAPEEKEEKSRDNVLIFDVQLVMEMYCGQAGEPKAQQTYWRDLAFGFSEQSCGRIRQLEESKLAAQNEKMQEIINKKKKQKREVFLREIGHDPSEEDEVVEDVAIFKGKGHINDEKHHSSSSSFPPIHFYKKSDDLGETAAEDWAHVKPVLENLVRFDKQEINLIRKTILYNYRLLRAAYKLYSGIGNDKLSSMSFAELCYLLQDTQIAENKDTDLIKTLIMPAWQDGVTDMYNDSFNRGYHKSNSKVSGSTVDNITRPLFFECLIRIFLSEDLYRLYQTRLGILSEGTLPLPSSRFRDLMNNYVVPFLETKTGNKMVKEALSSQNILDNLFVENVMELLQVYKKACKTFSSRPSNGHVTSPLLARSSRLSLRSLGLGSKSGSVGATAAYNQQQGSSTASTNLGIREFLVLLHAIGLVETTEDAHGSRFVLENRRVHKLSVSDAKSIFSASQFEDESVAQEESELNRLNFKEFLESLARVAFAVCDTSDKTVYDQIEFVIMKIKALEL